MGPPLLDAEPAGGARPTGGGAIGLGGRGHGLIVSARSGVVDSAQRAFGVEAVAPALACLFAAMSAGVGSTYFAITASSAT